MVHGGEKFASSVVITEEVKKAVEECNDLAPLHNPANLIGVSSMRKTYAEYTDGSCIRYRIPSDNAGKSIYVRTSIRITMRIIRVRRYGFHGTSHSFRI